MARGGVSTKSNPAKARKRVEATDAAPASTTTTAASLVRGKDGSAFARCDECNKDVPMALISFHSCSLDAKIKMNLEAQVVETEVKKKPAERKKATSKESKAKKAKKEKKGKNPNALKRPPTAFFLFMDDFRKEFKEANPDTKDIKLVAKQGGEKWKSLTEEEKKQYVDKATELKAEYEKALESNNADAENEDDGGSEKEGNEQEVQDDGSSEKEGDV